MYGSTRSNLLCQVKHRNPVERIMEGRRLRRFGRRRQPPSSSLLPVVFGGETASSDIANTVSCFYCDFKIRVLNEALYRFGRRHATWFRVWFSIGVGFSLSLVLGVSFLLLWSLLLHRNSIFSSEFGFGFGSSTSVSLAGAFNILLSTLISVSLHEFGHATAAASEGIRVEYIAVFIAVLFPGALVAFNHDFLEALPRLAALRVYCAGIWHNAACCAVCGLTLLLMPLIFSPFYIHGEGLMVLDVPSTSPLSSYLSPSDVIVSLDGVHVHDEQEWLEMVTLLDKQTLQGPNYSEYKGLEAVDDRKGYCVPNSMIEESKKIQLVVNQSACPDDFSAFVTVHCFNTSMSSNVRSDDGQPDKRESRYCLNAKDIVKLKKCGDGWVTPLTNESSCICSKDGSCLSPVQLPGLIWVEITYSRPYSLECLQHQSNLTSDPSINSIMEDYCGGTFVFVGDVISMAHSLRLTAYRPHSSSVFGAILPNGLERSLTCTFYVSLALALLNSLPVSNFIYNHGWVLALMRNHTKKELIRPAPTRFATAYLTLDRMLSLRQPLEHMFTSKEWDGCSWAKKAEGKEIKKIIFNDNFWGSMSYALKTTRPLVSVLRMTDSEQMPAMGFIYGAMDKAKEEIAANLGNVEGAYKEIWKIIDEKWEFQLHRHLHAAAYYLNPRIQYSDGLSTHLEIKVGLMVCMEKLIPDEEERVRANLQLNLFKNKQGFFAYGRAKNLIDNLSPADWWSSYGDEAPELRSFAVKILSLTCSSSACERNWSAFNLVYFLDGESILEVALCIFTFSSKRKREKVIQVCLLGGTLMAVLAFLRMFIIF